MAPKNPWTFYAIKCLIMPRLRTIQGINTFPARKIRRNYIYFFNSKHTFSQHNSFIKHYHSIVLILLNSSVLSIFTCTSLSFTYFRNLRSGWHVIASVYFGFQSISQYFDPVTLSASQNCTPEFKIWLRTKEFRVQNTHTYTHTHTHTHTHTNTDKQTNKQTNKQINKLKPHKVSMFAVSLQWI